MGEPHKTTALRLPQDLLDRATAMAERMNADSDLVEQLPGNTITKSGAMRLAMETGFSSLEAFYGVAHAEPTDRTAQEASP